MTGLGVPEEVRHFICTQIESVRQLEVLLLLRGAPDMSWTPDEVARALVSHHESAAAWLDKMTASSLLTEADGRYRYAPPDRHTDRTVDVLAESFATYRVTVIALIFSTPNGDLASWE